jgi:hypothetical protein
MPERDKPKKPLREAPEPERRIPFSNPERREAPPPDHGVPVPPRTPK